MFSLVIVKLAIPWPRLLVFAKRLYTMSYNNFHIGLNKLSYPPSPTCKEALSHSIDREWGRGQLSFLSKHHITKEISNHITVHLSKQLNLKKWLFSLYASLIRKEWKQDPFVRYILTNMHLTTHVRKHSINPPAFAPTNPLIGHNN